VTRFLREARIQARLDHPAIVPVYELGLEADGRPFFTMKRIQAWHLRQLLPTAGRGWQTRAKSAGGEPVRR
jgi:eukaryotic-like serine/threonine-protein kinase